MRLFIIYNLTILPFFKIGITGVVLGSFFAGEVMAATEWNVSL